MEETPHAATPAPNASPWTAALVVASLLILLLAGGLYALRTQLLARSERDSHAQAAQITALGGRIDRLESQLGTLAAAKPDTAPLDGLRQNFANASARLDALMARVDTLEKAPPLSAPPVTAPVAAVQPPAAPAAPLPVPPAVPNEAQQMLALRAVIAALPPVTADNAFMQSVNARLHGLVSVHKQAAGDPYAAVRQALDVATARAAIAALPEPQRAPFADWLKATAPAEVH